jgi:hypothetical protein
MLEGSGGQVFCFILYLSSLQYLVKALLERLCMETILFQFFGGMTGGSVSGKIVHLSDAGLVINAVTGALGGVAGGQLISHILGNTAVATGWDPGAFIGPFFDGALAGGLVQIAACMVLTRLLLHD